jgi:predicted dehydrogenase
VNEGAIGTLRGMSIFLSTPTDYMTSKQDHWANKLPGGVFGESGPHIVYMTLAFINPIRDVRAIGRKLLPQYPWSPFDDYRIDLGGESAACTTIMTYATNQWAAQVDLWGSEGMLHVDIESQVVSAYDRRDLKAPTIGKSAVADAAQAISSVARTAAQVITKSFHSTHQQVMAKFADAIREGAPSPVPAQEGREAVRVMDLITQQLQA